MPSIKHFQTERKLKAREKKAVTWYAKKTKTTTTKWTNNQQPPKRHAMHGDAKIQGCILGHLANRREWNLQKQNNRKQHWLLERKVSEKQSNTCSWAMSGLEWREFLCKHVTGWLGPRLCLSSQIPIDLRLNSTVWNPFTRHYINGLLKEFGNDLGRAGP